MRRALSLTTPPCSSARHDNSPEALSSRLRVLIENASLKPQPGAERAWLEPDEARECGVGSPACRPKGLPSPRIPRGRNDHRTGRPECLPCLRRS